MEKPLTAMLQPDGQPLDMAGYERAGGYQALRKALTMQPEAITAEVKRSKLRGRGGGGRTDATRAGKRHRRLDPQPGSLQRGLRA